MSDIYKPCPCGSGKKFKFCCNQLSNDDPNTLVKMAPIFTLSECSIMANWLEGGLAPILVVRQQPNLKYLFGMFMVDYYCLGLKETFFKANVKFDKIAEMKARLSYPLVPFEYEDARSLILGGIQYAKALGFEPQKDWKYTQYIIEADKPFENKFEYGKDGKPFYVSGPHDDASAILNRLKDADAHFLVGTEPSMGLIEHGL